METVTIDCVFSFLLFIVSCGLYFRFGGGRKYFVSGLLFLVQLQTNFYEDSKTHLFRTTTYKLVSTPETVFHFIFLFVFLLPAH